MLSDGNSKPSFAGTWGKERRARLQGGQSATNHVNFTTTYRDSFTNDHVNAQAVHQSNKFAKFVSIHKRRTKFFAY